MLRVARCLLGGFLLILAVSCATRPQPVAVIDVTKVGAVGDGHTLNSAALQTAIDACCAQGGGTVYFPAGRYVTGTIQLKDNVTLQLDAQAVLLGSTNAADYRNVDPFIDGTGAEMGYALVVALRAIHVGIKGPGSIDGRGKALSATQSRYTVRPFLVRWVQCVDVNVDTVQLRNSGAWTMHFVLSRDIQVSRVTIRSKGLANNDGLDIDSCEGVRVTDCDIDTGDDAICLKTTSAQPCRNVTVTRCQLASRCAAIKLGTESLADFEKIRVSQCQIRDTKLGGIKLLSVDGARLHDVIVSDIAMERVTVPIMMRLGARLKTFRAGDTPKTVGTLQDVTIRNVRATGAEQIGILVSGVPGHPVENISLENIDIQLQGGGSQGAARVQLPEQASAYPEIRMFGPEMPAYGMYLRHADGMTFKNVHFTLAHPDGRPAMEFIDARNISPKDFADGITDAEKRTVSGGGG
jgi:polygalacturonase